MNECLDTENQCPENQQCHNTAGSYECKQQSVLVLNSENRWSWKPAMIIAGEQTKLRCFQRDSNVEASYSCSVTWQNKFYVFGGNDFNRQISHLDGYRLKRIGSLDFNLQRGACTIMSEKIYLCFHDGTSNDHKRCRKSNRPTGYFSSVQDSLYGHRRISISSSDGKMSPAV